MRPRSLTLCAAVVLFALALGLPVHGDRPNEPALPVKTAAAWTLPEAMAQLELHPRDPYLQYVVMQLARRENKAEEVAQQIGGGEGRRARGRRAEVDLFSIFTGALAVQESLQLDTMRGERPAAGRRNRERPDAPPPARAAAAKPLAPPEFAALAPAPAASVLMLEARPGMAFEPVTHYKTVTETSYKTVTETVIGADGKPKQVEKKVAYTVAKNVPVTTYQEVPEAVARATAARAIAAIPALTPPAFAALAPAPAASVLMLQPRPGMVIIPVAATAVVVDQETKTLPAYKATDKPREVVLEQRETTVYSQRQVPVTVFKAVPEALARQAPADDKPEDTEKRRRREVVKLGDIKGPQIQGHPWRKMLGDQKPEIDPLAKLVPDDFYFVQFRSLNKMLDTADLSNLWGSHLFSQAQQEARASNLGEALKTQLALETNPLLRPFLDLAVDEVAVTGSDLFIREGSDVTLVVRYKQPALFKSRLDGFIANAEKAHPDAKRATGEYLGVKYDHLRTPDRAVCVYSAYPIENIHLRSNSLPALQRVIAAMRGKDDQGQPVRRLGETDEFAYIRTLYPRGAQEEDGLVYLSDPFIRRLVGPQVKLTERRRMLCYNHLRMIGHGAMMFRTEFGTVPTSLDQLHQAACCPHPFRIATPPADASKVAKLIADLDSNKFETREAATDELTRLGAAAEAALRKQLEGKPSLEMTKRIETLLDKLEARLICPDGGTYSLSKDGLSGTCSHHGHAHFLTPTLEIPLKQVSGEEADEYRDFLEDYNQYWRTFFDPIALRIQVSPERYRLETLVLPLIDNSIYTALAGAFSGKPVNLDAAPVPKRNILSLAARVNKDALLHKVLEHDTDPDLALAALAGGGLAYPYLRDVLNEDPEDTLFALAAGGVLLGVRQEESIKDQGLDGLRFLEDLGASKKSVDKLDVLTFVRRGISDRIGIHVYDNVPTVDLSLPQLFGTLGNAFGGRGGGEFLEPELLLFAAGAASLTTPVYFSIPVQDAGIVDRFGDQLEIVFAEMARKGARGGFLEPKVEFYTVPFAAEKTKLMRVFAVKFGPLKLRWFWARIGDTVYIASKSFILDDLLALHKNPPKPKDAPENTGHILVKLRPGNWDQVLQDYRLGWAENQREACLHNHGPLSSTARALTSNLGKIDARELAQLGDRIQRQADQLHQVHFYCPDGGKYVLSPDGRTMTCDLHGAVLAPKQPAGGSLAKQLEGVKEMTATLTFLPEGLRAVVVIARK